MLESLFNNVAGLAALLQRDSNTDIVPPAFLGLNNASGGGGCLLKVKFLKLS